MWEYINRKRGKKQKKRDNIEKEVWREYFMQLLEGTEIYELEKDKGKQEEDMREQEKEQEEKIKEEIKKAVKKMKVKKAASIDGIPMKAWKYAGGAIWK